MHSALYVLDAPGSVHPPSNEKSMGSVRITGGLGVEPPYLILSTPYLWSKFDPGGGRVSTPHLSFSKVGMLLVSHFLLMQFLKYLQCDDLNVTTILIHIEDQACPLPDCSLNFY